MLETGAEKRRLVEANCRDDPGEASGEGAEAVLKLSLQAL